MDTGGKIRTGKLLQKLKGVFDVTLVSNFDASKDAPHLHLIEQLCHAYYPVARRETTKYSATFYLELFTRLFSRYPITVIGDYSKALEEKILDLIHRFRYDLLICDFLQPSLNFRKVRGHPSVLFQHNIESVIPRRHQEVARNLVMKMFWWMQWRKMRHYEKEACQKFTGIITVSEMDKQKLVEQYAVQNVYAIPTGVDTNYFCPTEDKRIPHSLVFTGSMDWLPNEDAIIFFAKDILGKIKQQIPDVTLTVVGRNPSRRLLNELKNYPEVTVTGWVSDVRPYMSSRVLYVIPLRIGGGTRIKAFEAMAMGKAVVSTSVGVEGLPVCHGEHLVIHDESHEFASAIVRLLQNVDERRRLERNARSFVQNHFSWESTATAFAGICRTIVERGMRKSCRT